MAGTDLSERLLKKEGAVVWARRLGKALVRGLESVWGTEVSNRGIPGQWKAKKVRDYLIEHLNRHYLTDFGRSRFFVEDLEELAAKFADIHGMGVWEWEDVVKTMEGRLSLDRLERLRGGIHVRAHDELSSLVRKELELRRRAKQDAMKAE